MNGLRALQQATEPRRPHGDFLTEFQFIMWYARHRREFRRIMETIPGGTWK